MTNGQDPPVPPSDAPPPPPASEASPPPPPSDPPPGDSGPAGERNTLMLVLAYLGPLALVPLLAEKEDREVQWHAKNGIALFLCVLGLSIGLGVLSTAVAMFDFGCTGCFFTLVSPVLFLIVAVVSIVGIMKALQGERFRIPLVTDLAEKF